MKSSEFFDKFKSKYLWGNLTAMVLVVVMICFGVKFGLDLYTHHGESIVIPDVKHKILSDAVRIMEDAGLEIVVSDTGYVKTLQPDCVLGQTPKAGETVKAGRVIYVTINSPHTPTITLPDVIDNSSLREAMAKLTAMGFRLGKPKYIFGERDWVYGIKVRGRSVATGDKISIDDMLIIQVGNGERDSLTEVNYVYPEDREVMIEDEPGMPDDFEEVKGPVVEEKSLPYSSPVHSAPVK